VSFVAGGKRTVTAEKATQLREAAADKVEESRRALSTARSRAEAAADALKAIEKGRPI
jgi:hypothetical protein